MKKKIITLFPLFLLVLTSCDFSLNTYQGEHSAGLEVNSNSFSDSSSESNFDSSDESSDSSSSEESSSQISRPQAPSYYSYFSGSTFDTTGLNSSIISFQSVAKNASDITDIEEIHSFLDITNSSVFTTVADPNYVCTKDSGIMFIGSESENYDGSLTFKFNVSIEGVVIEAKPYSYIRNAYNEEELIVDHGAAIAVNDSPYILLSEDLIPEEENQIDLSECVYELNQDVTDVTIKVGPSRAVIETITVYYN